MSDLPTDLVEADLEVRSQLRETTVFAKLLQPGARLGRPTSMSVLRTMSLIAGAALLALGGSAIALLM